MAKSISVLATASGCFFRRSAETVINSNKHSRTGYNKTYLQSQHNSFIPHFNKHIYQTYKYSTSSANNPSTIDSSHPLPNATPSSLFAFSVANGGNTSSLFPSSASGSLPTNCGYRANNAGISRWYENVPLEIKYRCGTPGVRCSGAVIAATCASAQSVAFLPR